MRFFLLIALGSFCLGWAINMVRPEPLPFYYQSPEERLEHEIKALGVIDFTLVKDIPRVHPVKVHKKMQQGEKMLILDARPEVFHRLSHIQGALSLPRDEFKHSFVKLKDTINRHQNSAILIYCSDDSCEDSKMVASALIHMGCRSVMIIQGGWDAWSRYQLPSEHMKRHGN